MPLTLTHLARLLRPWRVAAVSIAVIAVFLMNPGHAHADIGLTFTLNDTTTNAQTAATGVINLEADLIATNTIVLTFPAGWVVADGAITGFATGGGSGFLAPPTVTGSSGARTVTFTLNAPQPALAPINLTLTGSAEIVNRATAAAGLTVLVDATGQAQGASAAFAVTAAATPVTGVTISASPLTENVATTVTVAFTPSATGALAATNTVTVTMAGYTLTNGAIAITPGIGFGGAGALTGNVTGGDTVTVTLGGTRSLAALTPGTFTFPATNPTAGTVAAAGLTVATSQDVTPVQSSAPINVAATAVTAVTISAAPLTASVASTVTVAFTPTATGALAAPNTGMSGRRFTPHRSSRVRAPSS